MSEFIQTFRAQCRTILTDSAVLSLAFGGFVIYTFLFPLPYGAELAKRNPIAVVDLDHSSLSRQLIQTAQASGAITVTHEVSDPASAAALVEDGTVRGYLIIPEDFRRDVLSGRAPVVAWGGDASYLNAYNQMAQTLSGSVGNLAAGIRFKVALANGQGAAAARSSLGQVTYVGRPLFNIREGLASYATPAVMVLVMQQMMLMTVGLLVAGHREQAGAQPHSPPGQCLQRLAGLTLPIVLIFMIHTVYFYGFSTWFWDLPHFGRLLPVFLFMLTYTTACAFFGFAIAGLFRQREAAVVPFAFSGIPFACVGGFMWPHHALVLPLRLLSWLIPSTAGIQGTLQLMQMGASFKEVLPRWIGLCALILVYTYPALRTVSKSAKA